MTRFEALVVGSGVIGLSIANALQARGMRVGLVDDFPGSGASGVAAGMLAPITEAAYGEEEIAALAIRSRRAWPAFAAELELASGLGVGYRQTGTLLVAADAGDANQLRDLLGYHADLGLASSWLAPSAARDLEPLLAPSIRGAIYAPDDAQVDNRRLLAALVWRARQLGVQGITARVEQVLLEQGGVRGVATRDDVFEAPIVVLAAGWSTGLVPGLDDVARPPVHPVKGQIARLRVPSRSPVPTMTVRAIVQGTSVYVVPRADRQVVLGATVEDQGVDRTLTAGGLYALLRDGSRILPALLEYEVTEFSAGLRPGSLDNAAIVGPSGIDGLLLACGHYRNGILFAPVTVDAITALIEGGELPDWASPLHPRRLTAEVLER